MSGDAQIAFLADGKRLHLQHGPIDIVAEAFGSDQETASAYAQASEMFGRVLPDLVAQIEQLRAPIAGLKPLVHDPVSRAMIEAVWPHRACYVTPMAAVAGAVADHVLAALVCHRTLSRAYINNGGDIAFHIAPGEALSAGIVDNQDLPALDAHIALEHDSPVRGLATSGWRGRSQSLGIADAVTVLAANSAQADVAATLIANSVNVEHSAIERWPANSLRDDTDLGTQLVTVAVGVLPPNLRDRALDAGAEFADMLRQKGLLVSAYLSLQGAVRVAGGNGFLLGEAAQ